MRPPRIAVLETTAHVGGAQISLLELVRRLKGDPQVTLILPEDGPLHARAIEAGAEVRILTWPQKLMGAGEGGGVGRAAFAGLALPGLARRLAGLLDEIGADVLVTNGIKAHVLGAAAQLRSRRPLFWYMRDGLEARRLSRWFLLVCARRCTGAIAISRYVEREARKILTAKVPVRVVYNIVDFERFGPAGAGSGDLHKERGEIWFGVVGSLTPLKGQDIFLEAAAEVAKALPQARFVIVGSNFYRTQAASTFEQELRRSAQRPELANRVRFLGQRDDIAGVLALLDVLVQPNRGPEGLGRAVLEAMACGVPVIAVDRWGPAELIEDGRTGLLTPHLDARALAERMIALGRDSGRRAQLAAAASIWVRETLEPERLVCAFRDFLKETGSI
jgi:glycosyltransferase involved in cell wall biosynthesis